MASWQESKQVFNVKIREHSRLIVPIHELAALCSNDVDADVKLFLQLEAVFPSNLAKNQVFINTMIEAYGQLMPLLTDQTISLTNKY